MQWSPSPNAGFTAPNVKPWMSVVPDYPTINAEAELKDRNSTFHYWRTILGLRKQYLNVFVYGDYVLLDRRSNEVFAYSRQYEDQQAVVLCNWTDRPIEWDPTANGVKQVKEVLLSNYDAAGQALKRFEGRQWSLRPYEAAVMFVEP